MIKVIALVLLMACVCLPSLYAQEMAAQGWAVPEPGQHPSGAVSRAVTGSAHDTSRSSSGALIPTVVPRQNGEEGRPPFPVLTPKAIVYPRRAVRQGWEGQTVVAAEVLPDGSVGRTAVAKSSGHKVLDQAAQEAIESWEFGTESENDEAVPQFVDIPVTFKLQNED
ncbi:MAG: energy transducer TonB [Candidatus Omnitrophica bacterium]|nr:energy transducer TonB [Candidatus Omnitrophota bacterium]